MWSQRRPAAWTVASRRGGGHEGARLLRSREACLEDVRDPVVSDPEDVVVQVDAFTICGTDLHILRGDVPEVEPGRVLGHEAVGTVTSVGAGVRRCRPAIGS